MNRFETFDVCQNIHQIAIDAVQNTEHIGKVIGVHNGHVLCICAVQNQTGGNIMTDCFRKSYILPYITGSYEPEVTIKEVKASAVEGIIILNPLHSNHKDFVPLVRRNDVQLGLEGFGIFLLSLEEMNLFAVIVVHKYVGCRVLKCHDPSLDLIIGNTKLTANVDTHGIVVDIEGGAVWNFPFYSGNGQFL